MRSAAAITVVAVLLLLTSCGQGEHVNTSAPDSIKVSSSAFEANGSIPEKYSCKGNNVSPPLSWSGVPTAARELALVVDDPDAPRGTFTHWVLFRLQASTTSLEEGKVPEGAKQAKNSAGDAAYFGPCPPSGTHHYRFTLYALDQPLGLPNAAPLEDAVKAISDHALAQGRLTGVFTAR